MADTVPRRGQREIFETPMQHVILGKFYLHRKAYRHAIGEFKKALAMNSSHIKANYWLATAYYEMVHNGMNTSPQEKQMFLSQAALYYKKIVSLAPYSPLSLKVKKILISLRNELSEPEPNA